MKNFCLTNFLTNDLSDYNIENEYVVMKDIKNLNKDMSSSNINSSLFNAKMRALMDYVASKLSDNNIDFEIINHRLTTPKKRVPRSCRNGHLIFHDNVKIIKIKIKMFSDHINSDSYIYIIPYVDKVKKTTCKVNLALINNIKDFLRNVKDYTYSYSEEYCIVNAFKSLPQFYIHKMDDDFKLNAGRVVSLVTKYGEYVLKNAQNVIKENKKTNMLTKLLLGTFKQNLTKKGYIIDTEYLNARSSNTSMIRESVKISLTLTSDTMQICIFDVNKYSAIINETFNSLSVVKLKNVINEIDRFTESYNDINIYLKSLQ